MWLVGSAKGTRIDDDGLRIRNSRLGLLGRSRSRKRLATHRASENAGSLVWALLFQRDHACQRKGKVTADDVSGDFSGIKKKAPQLLHTMLQLRRALS